MLKVSRMAGPLSDQGNPLALYPLVAVHGSVHMMGILAKWRLPLLKAPGQMGKQVERVEGYLRTFVPATVLPLTDSIHSQLSTVNQRFFTHKVSLDTSSARFGQG